MTDILVIDPRLLRSWPIHNWSDWPGLESTDYGCWLPGRILAEVITTIPVNINQPAIRLVADPMHLDPHQCQIIVWPKIGRLFVSMVLDFISGPLTQTELIACFWPRPNCQSEIDCSLLAVYDWQKINRPEQTEVSIIIVGSDFSPDHHFQFLGSVADRYAIIQKQTPISIFN